MSALTDYGYDEMAGLLQSHGLKVPADADIRLHLPLLSLIKDLLKKPLVLNPYSALFERDASPEDEKMMQKMNDFLAALIPILNAGGKPDIKKLAKAVGIDAGLAAELTQHAISSMTKGTGNDLK